METALTDSTAQVAKTDPAAKDARNEADILEQAHARFQIANTAEMDWRKDAVEDAQFEAGQQWKADTITARQQEGRPCLTINKLASIKSQIVNEQRAQRPSMRINPVGDGADVDLAENWQGLLRHIEVNSDAEVAYDTAFESMVIKGKGYIELSRDYLPGDTFDQEIYIKRIKNNFMVYCDPSSEMPDESDANWKFKVRDYPLSEYKDKWPNSQLASATDYSSIGDNMPDWVTGTNCRVAEYWHKDWSKETIYKLVSGDIISEQELAVRVNAPGIPPPAVIGKRVRQKCVVTCDVINAVEILETYIWPGEVGYIPLIPVLGEDYDCDGKRMLYGIIRNAKDQQKMINFTRSATAEMVALAPKAPYLGWKGQFKDSRWATANTVNWSYLESDYPINAPPGAQISLPQRQQGEPPVQALFALNQAMDQDLKDVTGIYSSSLGQDPPGQQSGKAIDLLQKQGGLTNLNFTDNLSRTLRAVARCCMDAAPFVYDAPRVQRILKPDGSSKMVIAHAGRPQAAQSMATEDIKEMFDLSVGTYDVVIDVGPSYQTKRQEAWAMQVQLAQAYPKLLDVAGDIMLQNSDAPGAREIAERIRKTIPPQLLDDDGTDPKIALQKSQATAAQLTQQNQQLQQENMKLQFDAKAKHVETQGKLESDQYWGRIEIEKAGLAAQLEQAKQLFAQFEAMHGAAHDVGTAAAQPPPEPPDGTSTSAAAPAEGD